MLSVQIDELLSVVPLNSSFTVESFTTGCIKVCRGFPQGAIISAFRAVRSANNGWSVSPSSIASKLDDWDKKQVKQCYGKPWDPDHDQKALEAPARNPLTDEQRQKISAALKKKHAAWRASRQGPQKYQPPKERQVPSAMKSNPEEIQRRMKTLHGVDLSEQAIESLRNPDLHRPATQPEE